MEKKNQSDSEPTEQLTVRIEPGLAAAVKATKPKGFTIGHVWSLAAQLWLALPKEVQEDMMVDRIRPKALVDASTVVADAEARIRAIRESRETRRKPGGQGRQQGGQTG